MIYQRDINKRSVILAIVTLIEMTEFTPSHHSRFVTTMAELQYQARVSTKTRFPCKHRFFVDE